MKALATASELNRLVSRWAEHSAVIDSASLTAFSEKLAAMFGVKSDEVAILAVTGKGKHLAFLVPEKLKAVGSIPVNSTTALVARTELRSADHRRSGPGLRTARRQGEMPDRRDLLRRERLASADGQGQPCGAAMGRQHDRPLR